jgi:hypothetical protein
MYIVGVSRLFFIVWRMVRPWLDAHTASKISFLTSEDAAAVLQDAIDPSQLPLCYGGALNAPWDDAAAAAAAAAAGGGDEGGSAAGTPPGTPRGSGAALPGTPSGGGGVAPPRGAGVLAAAGSAPPTPPRGGGGATPPPPGREGSPMRRRGHGSRGGSVDFSGIMPPPGGHARGGGGGHSRSTSADMTLRRTGTPLGFYAAPSGGGGPGHRRMVSEDAMSMASWASAMSMDDSDNEFFDAVDLYVEARLAEVEDAAAAAGAGGSSGSGGGAASKADAAGGDRVRRGGASRRMTFDLGAAGSGRNSTSSATSGAGGLEPIPEHRVISEVRGRLNRVRLLLDSTNVLTCIAGVVLIAYGDAPFEPQTLKVFGGVIMTVSLVSIIAGLAVSISAVSLCICARDCLFGQRVRERTETEVEEEEGEGAV